MVLAAMPLPVLGSARKKLRRPYCSCLRCHGWGPVIQDLNCYEAIRESYSATLENKSFVAHGKYHPALDTLAPRLQKQNLVRAGRIGQEFTAYIFHQNP